MRRMNSDSQHSEWAATIACFATGLAVVLLVGLLGFQITTAEHLPADRLSARASAPSYPVVQVLYWTLGLGSVGEDSAQSR
jgi:hypothetical protein